MITDDEKAMWIYIALGLFVVVVTLGGGRACILAGKGVRSRSDVKTITQRELDAAWRRR